MRLKLQNYLLKIHQKFKLTTLLISHDISEVIKLADRVVILENGKIERQGSPLELFTGDKMSGKFQFTGEIVQIEKEDVVYIITVLIDSSFVKVIANDQEIQDLTIGDKVAVASKAFNPIISKIKGL